MTFGLLVIRQSYSEQCRCIRRMLLTFSCIRRDVPTNMFSFTAVGYKLAIMIRPSSEKESRVLVVHEGIGAFWAPFAIRIHPSIISKGKRSTALAQQSTFFYPETSTPTFVDMDGTDKLAFDSLKFSR